MRVRLITKHVLKLAIPRTSYVLNPLDWRIIRNMLKVIFRDTITWHEVSIYQVTSNLGSKWTTTTSRQLVITGEAAVTSAMTC